MPCFWWTLVHFRSKEKLFSGRQSATRVKRCRSFFSGSLWRFCFIFFRIFCFVYLRQYLNKNIYRFTSDTNQTPDVGALRCAGGGVGADYRLPVPRTTDNDTVLRFAVETYSPRVDRFHRCLLSVHLLLTCFRFFDFIYQKKLFNCSDLNYFYFNFQSFSKYFFKALQFKLIKKKCLLIYGHEICVSDVGNFT